MAAEAGRQRTGRRGAPDFRVLAFWLGSVVTDASGRATADVKLPESLTAYRIMAMAGDKLSRFGSGAREIRIEQARPPESRIPALPRGRRPRVLRSSGRQSVEGSGLGAGDASQPRSGCARSRRSGLIESRRRRRRVRRGALRVRGEAARAARLRRPFASTERRTHSRIRIPVEVLVHAGNRRGVRPDATAAPKSRWCCPPA